MWKRLSLLLLLFLSVASASAGDLPRQYFSFTNQAGAIYTATVGACSAWWAQEPNKAFYGNGYTNTPGNRFCNGYSGQAYFLLVYYKCPDGSFVADGGTVCGSTWPPDPPPNPCLNNDTKNSYVRKFVYGAGASGLPTDDGLCKIKNPKLLRCYVDSKGVKYCFFEFFKTTDQKDTSQPDDPSPGSSDVTDVKPDTVTDKTTVSPPMEPDSSGSCPEGTVQIGSRANGDPICAGTGKYPDSSSPPPPPTTTKPPVTVTNDDGSTKTTQDVVQTNADGSHTTTTTTTTVAADGSKSVTISSVTSAGASGQPGRQDSSSDNDKYDLCKQNPMLSVCRNSSVNGDCGALTCQGDAIQCASLRKLALMQCADKKDRDDLDASPLGKLADAVIGGADPMASSLPSKSKADAVSMPTSLDQTGWLGAGAPFPDKTFTLQGRTFTIPFSQAAQYLVVFRYAIMVVALLVSFKILSGAILRE